MINPPDLEKMFSISKAEITLVDVKAFEVFTDLCVLYDKAKSMPETSQRGLESLYTANEITNILVKGNYSHESYDSAQLVSQGFFQTRNRQGQHTTHAMGHCHIDSAWLWRYGETVHKCARSWISALSLMDKFPDFKFVCSQAQQFQWVKDNYPLIYEKLKYYVKKGTFIPVGGTWVEMDGNLPSGESMVRQFFFGQKFFRKEFGITCNEFWLPDTFGYSANLPQIMNGSGITNFLTQKLSWSLVNTFPHNTFHWQGIDGSKVLCHFPPGDSYGMMATPSELLKTMNNHKDKGRSNSSIFLFGFGDGGGGPTEGMVQRLSRMADCAGLPRVKMSTPNEFFHEVRENADKLCTWVGELFLELHNGTYTTHAKIKNYNRKCEILLHDVEFLYTLLHTTKSVEYPSEQLERLWKLLLLNQFHDVLPGTSIELANVDATVYYEDIVNTGNELLRNGIRNFFVQDEIESYAVMNTLSWERSEVVEMPDKTLKYIRCPGLSIGHIVEPPRSSPVIIQNLDDGAFLLSNGIVECHIDKGGRLVSLKLTGLDRELIKTNCYGNQFVIFDDVPLYWDAWDVMDYHLETRTPLLDVADPLHISDYSCELRGGVEFTIRVGVSSYLRQMIQLDAGSAMIKFKTYVDWHENRKFLKVEFPFNMLSAKATYEIQFGHLERPTHQNTSWDTPRFEVWGHKWADLSEYNCGVALLNDSKYGYSAFGSTMRLSLLRSPKAPDANADMGKHEFTYALFPHQESLQASGVIKQSYGLNYPLHLFTESVLNNTTSFITLSEESVILETLKQSDIHCGAILLRCYEAFGGSTSVEINFNIRKITKVVRCNLLEDFSEEQILRNQDCSFITKFSPFEIKSFLVWLE